MKTAIFSITHKPVGRLSLAFLLLIMISSCSFDATKRRYNNGWNLNFTHKNVGLDLPKNKIVPQGKSIFPPSQDSLLIHHPLEANNLATLPLSELFKISQSTQPYHQSYNNKSLPIEKYTEIEADFNELTQEELNSIEKRHNKRYLSIFYKFILSIAGIVLGIFSLIVADILWIELLFLLGGLLVFFSIIFMLAFLLTLAIINKEDPIYERYLRRYLHLGLASVFLLGLFLSPLFFILGYRSKDKFFSNTKSNSFESNFDISKILLVFGILAFIISFLVVYGGVLFFLF